MHLLLDEKGDVMHEDPEPDPNPPDLPPDDDDGDEA